MSTAANNPFSAMSSLHAVASALGCSAKQLKYLLYGRAPEMRYSTFCLAKRRGGERIISAPMSDLKAIQRRLLSLILSRERVRQAAHGFTRGRSVVTNAGAHVRRRTVLNLDLQDFFPTINVGRVRGLFMASPFDAPAAGATVLAHICCHDGSLPQGAPTSPTLSNMICWRMDARIQHLAHSHGCIYTRYADDITVSKRKGPFPASLATLNAVGRASVGHELRAIIEESGFAIHPEKIQLFGNTERQTVTGLTVNTRVNVPREFVRNIRATICDWRKRGLEAAQAEHHARHYRHHGRLRDPPPLTKLLKGKLDYLKMVQGVNDPVRRNLQRQLVGVWPEYSEVIEKEIRRMPFRELFISHASEDKDGFVRMFAAALIRQSVSVWYDEFELTIGDDLVAKVNDGLARSRYGVVVLSPSFFSAKKTWPDREVGALFALEDADKRSRVLPLWHQVEQADVAARSPILAGKLAWRTADFSPDELAVKFRQFLDGKGANH